MKSLALLLFSLLLNISAFTQNGIYLFGQMENAPGVEVEVSVEIFSTPPTTTSVTVGTNGQIPITWVPLPAGYWPSLIATFGNCDSTLSTHIVYNDSLNNLIDVYLDLNYCENQEIYGCTDPDAINYHPNATIDDGSCLYSEPGCVEVNLNQFCIDTLSIAYDITIQNDAFCCNNAWDQICQDAYVINGGQPLDDCADDVVYGCTDPSAINYNPEATDDDGSCTYVNDGCVGIDTTLYCIDVNSVAYETTIQNDTFCCETQWDQICQNAYVELGGLPLPGCEGIDISGCTDPAATNYNPNATIDDGSCQYDDSCDANSVEILITTGTWGSEMSWNLTYDGVEIAGDGGYQDNSTYSYPLCLEDSCYTFKMYDSFGDGWNGGTFSIQMDGETIASGTLYSGELGFVNFGINSPGCDSLNYFYGCTDPNAINYDPNATMDDGSCEYDSDVENDLCADAAELQPGTQIISNVGAVNNENIWGECWAFGNGEGEQTSIWYSFTTPNEPATIHIEASPDGTNTLTDTQFGLFYECGGEMIYCDGNAGQGLFSAFTFECGELEENTTYILMIDGYFGDMGTCNLTYEVQTGCVSGCTDPLALNYDPNATSDDGSCVYDESCTENEVTLLVDGSMSNYGYWQLFHNNGGFIDTGEYSDGTMDWNQCLESGCYVLVVNSYSIDSITSPSVMSVIHDNQLIEFGQLTDEINYFSFGINTNCDSTDVYGCTDPEALNYDPNATVNDGSCEYETECTFVTMVLDGPSNNQGYFDLYSSGNGYLMNDGYNGSDQTYEWCLEDGCYELFFIMGNGGILTDEIVYTIFQDDSIIAGGTLMNQTSIVNFGINSSCDSTDIYGCTDPEAINFSPNATVDDGSCEYEEEGCVDVDSAFCVDVDSEAYQLTILNDSFCCTTQWDQICQNAYIDNDGPIGEGCEIYGCTDPEALNFNPGATMDDGSCEYSCTDIDLGFDFFNGAPADSSQMSWTIVNNDGEVVEVGFFYNWAPQYDLCLEDGCYELTVFDVPSEWDGTYYLFTSNETLAQGTFNGDESTFITTFGVNAEDCDDEDVFGCTDPNADNYNPNANIDDGSCEYEFECAISFTVSPDSTGAQVIWITPSFNIYNAVSVEWDFGDGNTSSALFPVHTYDGDGPYMLCLSAMFEDNGEFCEITYCAELTDEMINPPGMQTEGFSINVVDPTGTTSVIEQETIGDLVLWPNPANDVVQIQYALNQNTNLMLDVYNSIGKQVRSTNVAGHNGKNQFSLDVADLTPGMYVIRLTGNKEQITARLVVR